jgi:hypothetical protein
VTLLFAAFAFAPALISRSTSSTSFCRAAHDSAVVLSGSER